MLAQQVPGLVDAHQDEVEKDYTEAADAAARRP